MKRLSLAAALGTLCVSTLAQGTLNFSNFGGGLQAKVTDTDGTTGLAGNAWNADLFWAPGIVTDSTLLAALGQPTSFSTDPQYAGFFFAGTRTISGETAASIITAQIRVWDTAHGTSWVSCHVINGARVGESILFQVTLGNAGSPAVMTELNGHPWSVILTGVHAIKPPLTITSTPNHLLLSWSTPAAAFAVQQNPDLNPAHWTTLTNASVVVGSQNQVTLPTSQGSMFYRLISQ